MHFEQHEDDLILSRFDQVTSTLTDKPAKAILKRIETLVTAREEANAAKQAKLDAVLALETKLREAIAEAEKAKKEAEDRVKREHEAAMEALLEQEIEREKALKKQVEEEFRRKLEAQMARIGTAEEKLKQLEAERDTIIFGIQE